ncbi:MAG: cysteine peptidase family C39 domain-containing protein [Candidatus Izemoplasmatales bacterium]|jgi:hypothetical protein
MITHGGDIWEGNTITDVDKVASFFEFMYVRIWGGNTKVGKEKDVLFDTNWAKLKGKVARATYFEVQPAWSPEQNVERYKRNYPSNDPGEIPELIVYEIEQSEKSQEKMIYESTIIFEEISMFLGHTPWIYTGRWYWDPVFGTTSLAVRSEMIIASYYWSNAYARSRVINSYGDLQQFIPPGWTTPVLGGTNPPTGYQWSGDQFKVPGLTGYMDFIQSLYTVEQMKAMRTGTVTSPVEEPELIATPAYIELSKNIHALNVSFISQLGSGADKFHNDCGAACVSMLVSAYTQQNVSVDEIYSRIQPNADTYLSVTQLKNALAWYDINVISSYDLSKEFLWSKTIEKKPFIALISYKPIHDANLDDDTTFTGMHFVVVVGLDADGVLIHDPLVHNEVGGFRHLPFNVYDAAVRSAGAGVLIVPTKPLGESQSTNSVNYLVTVETRYVRTAPSTVTGVWVMSKQAGDIVSIEELNSAGTWGRLTGTTYWMYMSGLVKSYV